VIRGPIFEGEASGGERILSFETFSRPTSDSDSDPGTIKNKQYRCPGPSFWSSAFGVLCPRCIYSECANKRDLVAWRF
jgi:hypothetical protein